MDYTIKNFTDATATATATDGWVTLTVGDGKIILNDDEVETLVTALRSAARDAAESVLRPLDDEAATNLKLLCAIAADFWDKDQPNPEYERGQAELIRDFVRWQGWPPAQTTIIDHIRASMR